MTAARQAPAPVAGTRPRPRPWWANKVFLVPASLIVIAAVALVTDLPTTTTSASQISDATSLMKQVNADVAPCTFAVKEALGLYRDLSAGALDKSQRGQVPGLLSDDQSACAFTDSSIYQLSTLQAPGTASGKLLGRIVGTVTLWATSDALSAIEAVQAYEVGHAAPAVLGRLAKAEALMNKDREEAESALRLDNRLLHTRLPALALAQAPPVAARS